MTAEIIELHPAKPIYDGHCEQCQCTLFRLEFHDLPEGVKIDIICSECNHLAIYVVDQAEGGAA